MKPEKICYLCNGEACEKQCAKTMTADEWSKYVCHHTTDERFARNKVRRNRKFEVSRHNGEVCYTEVEKNG